MGDAEAVGFAEGFVEPGGGAGGFVAEEEAVFVGVGRVPVGFFGLGGEEPEAAGGAGVFLEGFPVVVVEDVEGFPVVHAAALEVAVGDAEA